MLFLITLANKGQETMFARRRGTEHFSYNFYTYTNPFYSELMEEHNRNRVARPVLGPYTTWSTGTRTLHNLEYRYSTFIIDTLLSVPVFIILRAKNNIEYQYPTLSTGT